MDNPVYGREDFASSGDRTRDRKISRPVLTLLSYRCSGAATDAGFNPKMVKNKRQENCVYVYFRPKKALKGTVDDTDRLSTRRCELWICSLELEEERCYENRKQWDGISGLVSSLTCMGIFPCLASIFTKGYKYYDFLFVSLDNKILPNGTFTVKNLFKS